MSNDLVYIIWWWLWFFAIGVISIPFTWLILGRFIDIGYGFAKTIGLLVIAFTVFLLAIFRIAPLTNTTLYLIFFGYLFLNIHICRKYGQKIYSQILKNSRIIIAQEIIFTIGFLLWTYVRAHQPDIVGLEKLMDVGFINSILKAKYLPPIDMWFAGKPINYYWFGHFYVAIITKLSNIPAHITYNLMLATILGIGLTGAFSISATLTKKLNLRLNKRVAYAAGIISAILLIFAGNFHTPFYILKNGRDKYWYPDATRFIGYNPETEDKTIHEFPLYSFVVSDLHAHLINFPFVLLYLALLWNCISNDKKMLRVARVAQVPRASRKNSRDTRDTLDTFATLIPLGFVLGVMFTTSAWDFANYSLVTGLVLLFLEIKRRPKIDIEFFWSIAKVLITILIIAGLTALPFVLNFESLAQGVKLTHTKSPLWQLAILWGFPAILTIFFAGLLYAKWPKLKLPDIFVGALLVSSWTLIIIPEIIFVKDIYIASHYRANTMFKLTYQAFVMSYLSSGYIVIRILTSIKNKYWKFANLVFFALLFASILQYPKIATKSYYGDLKVYKGLNGEIWLKNKHPDLYNSVLWFRKNVEGQPTILEAPGDSYTEFNVISSYTGLPTVSGWFVHEWLWRGGSEFPQERVGDITQIYTSSNLASTKNLLGKYSVEYVIVGKFERQKYPNLSEEKFGELGEVIFTSGNTLIYKLNI
jgi:uncharacterized membrane protein